MRTTCRSEMAMLEGEATKAMSSKASSTLTPTRCLGRVWHAPLSWANVMIRRFVRLSQDLPDLKKSFVI